MKQTKGSKNTAQKESRSNVVKIKNVYKGISTEEKIRLYLRICRYVMDGEELQTGVTNEEKDSHLCKAVSR